MHVFLVFRVIDTGHGGINCHCSSQYYMNKINCIVSMCMQRSMYLDSMSTE